MKHLMTSSRILLWVGLDLIVALPAAACTREVVKEVPVEKQVIVEKPIIREVEKQIVIEKPVEKIVESRIVQVGELQPATISTPTGWDTASTVA